jgi:hypothetical protein
MSLELRQEQITQRDGRGKVSGGQNQVMSQRNYLAMRAQMLQAQYQRGEMSGIVETRREITREDEEDLESIYAADPGVKEFIHSVVNASDMGWR